MRKYFRLVLALLLVSVLGLYPLLAPAHGIDMAHFDLIRDGMTPAEVESIFGVPPGNYDWAEPKQPGQWTIRPSPPQPPMADDLDSATSQAKNALAELKRFHGLGGARAEQTEQRWTSRNGSFAIWFAEGKVVKRAFPEAITIAPPWQQFWTKLKH